jgi:hypothetical protein
MPEMSVSFRVIKPCVKAAKVPWLMPMGKEIATTLAGKLATALPLHGREAELIPELAEKGHYYCQELLGFRLPELAIGYNFDKSECRLLDELAPDFRPELLSHFRPERAVKMCQVYYQHDQDAAFSLLDEMRSRNPKWGILFFSSFGHEASASEMWHAYYGFDNDSAIGLLCDLAIADPELAKTALLGTKKLAEAGPFMAKKIMLTSAEMGATLTRVLVRFNDQTILQAVKDLPFELLADEYMWDCCNGHETLNEGFKNELEVILTALGVSKAFKFYRYLTGIYCLIDRSTEFDRKYPSATAFVEAMNWGSDEAAGNKAAAVELSRIIVAQIEAKIEG